MPEDAEIVRNEVFGPVLVALPFDDEDDAVRIANDSVYGLSGGVFSGDHERRSCRSTHSHRHDRR